MKPRLLDLFCGAGGCTVGYQLAGFDCLGIDIEVHHDYPRPFMRYDAVKYLREYPEVVEGFDAIHASPPCQGYTTMNNRHGSKYPLLIDKVRDLLIRTGKPYVIENVPGARRFMRSPVELTGEMFGLRVHRPRLFESNIALLVPPRPPRQRDPVAVYGKQDGRRLWTRADGTELHVADLETASAAMNIDWMTWDDLREAVPPAYTEHIGRQLLAHLEAAS